MNNETSSRKNCNKPDWTQPLKFLMPPPMAIYINRNIYKNLPLHTIFKRWLCRLQWTISFNPNLSVEPFNNVFIKLCCTRVVYTWKDYQWTAELYYISNWHATRPQRPYSRKWRRKVFSLIPRSCRINACNVWAVLITLPIWFVRVDDITPRVGASDRRFAGITS